MTPPSGNRADQARAVLFWDAVADNAAARAAAAREDLAAAARAELARDGTAPTWRIPGVGTVPLALSIDAVVVADTLTYTRWVAQRYPDEVEQRVRPEFDKWLRRRAAQRGDPPCDDHGEAIPGVRFVAGGAARGVSVRPEPAARESAAAAALAFLDRQGGEG